jgi:phage FluMu protein Com
MQLQQPETQSDSHILSRVVRLPEHVLDLIFDELHVLDRCALALTCRRFLTFAQKNEHLDYIIHSPPHERDLQYFFEAQLGVGWIPADLRYCSDCGRFVSTDPIHWRHVVEKYTREHTGRISNEWRKRREEGWLKYWIDRWCGDGSSDPNSQALFRSDATKRLCPRCAVLNPETNAWRLKRLEARTQKHASNRALLLSPGLYSQFNINHRLT